LLPVTGFQLPGKTKLINHLQLRPGNRELVTGNQLRIFYSLS
jgi:hypothetical protein